MKTKTSYSLHPLVLLLLSVGSVWAQRGPQDSWYLDREIDLPIMPGMNNPRGIHITANGDIYVCDVGDNNDRISVWRADGSFKTAFSSYGGNDENIRDPHGIAVGQNVIVVTDSYNHRIKIFDLDGKFIRKWGNHGNGDGQMKQPRDVFIDSNGLTGPELYVCDKENHRIQVFDLNGTFIRKFGTHGDGDGQLDNPQGIEIGPDGLIYVCSTNDRRVLIFQKDGSYIRRFDTTRKPYHLSFIGSRVAVTTDYHSVRIFETNGTMVSMIGTESAGSSEGEFNLTYGISIDTTGLLHIADANNHRIQVFDANGTHQRTYGFKGTGNLKVTDMDLTPEDTLLLSDEDGDRIFEIDLNGTFLTSFGSGGDGNGYFNNPTQLVLSPSDEIFVTDKNNHRVQVFDRNGTFLRKFGTSGNADGQFNEPWGLAFSQAGEVYVSDKNNHRIQVFDQNGSFLRKWGSSGSLEGQFNKPHGIAFSDTDELMVCDYDNSRLVFFDSLGTYIQKWNLPRGYNFYRGTSYVQNLNNGLVYTGGGNYGGGERNYVVLFENGGETVKKWTHQGDDWTIGESLPNGNLLVINRKTDQLLTYRSTYRSVRPEPSKEIPLPEVISVTQRLGTNYLDVTYRVNDADSVTVQAALLGFVDGGNDLSKVIVPKTFVGNTDGKLGQNVPTGQIHTVTWNAGADWNVGFGELEMAILAKDDRDLLNLHFLTLPATESNSTELKINRSPITDDDLLNVWYWLLATNNQQNLTISGNKLHFPIPESTYSPSGINGIRLWVDANDVDGNSVADNLSNGTQISHWINKSNNQANASQNVSAKQPTISNFGQSGLSVIRFDGNDFLDLNLTWLASTDYTVVALESRRSSKSSNYYLGNLTGNSPNMSPHFGWRDYNTYTFAQSSNDLNYDDSNYNDQVFRIWTHHFDSTVGHKLFLGNGVKASNSNKDGFSQVFQGTIGRAKGNYFNGDLAELIAFDRAILDSERINLINYLRYKWGLPESSLATGSSTSDTGKAYLLDLMNLREATVDEVTRAKEGATTGMINQFTPSFQVGPNERPDKVNEYGFDTGSTSGIWVVPTQ